MYSLEISQDPVIVWEEVAEIGEPPELAGQKFAALFGRKPIFNACWMGRAGGPFENRYERKGRKQFMPMHHKDPSQAFPLLAKNPTESARR